MPRIIEKVPTGTKRTTTPGDAAPGTPLDEGNFEQQRDNQRAAGPGDDAGQWSGGPN